MTTGYPAVHAQLCKMKITFDAWQVGAGKAILSKRADGLYAADAVVLSIPRQVGKTFLVGALVLALAILTPRTTVLWSAHRYPTAEDAFNDMKALAEQPAVARYVAKIYDSAGKQQILLKNRSRIYFGARERGWGRGFKRVAIIVFDEAQILTERGVDDMVPSTNRHPNPLIFYMGTPPKPSDPSEHFMRMREEAISGESADVLYVEMSADDDAEPKDREQWAKANPSYPHHTTARAMLRMLRNLGLASFMREALGIWDGIAALGAFTPGAWARCATTNPPDRPAALGIAADLEQTWLSLGAASKRKHVGAVHRMRFDTEREAFCGEVARMCAEYKIPVVIDEKGPASPIIPDLKKLNVRVIEIGLDERSQACVDMRTEVEMHRVAHNNNPELNEAVDAASWVLKGDRRVFGRKDGDNSMLEAVAFALTAATQEAGFSMYGAGDLDMCDRCREKPHGDPEGVHNYLCPDCRKEV